MMNKIYKILTIVSFSLISIFLHYSCAQHYQPDYIIYYNVFNKTDSEIKIQFKLYSPFDHFQYDSIVQVYPGTVRPLIVSLHKRAFFYFANPENENSLQKIKNLKIFKNDTIPSNKDLNLTEYWLYTELDDNRAELLLTVNTEDFN